MSSPETDSPSIKGIFRQSDFSGKVAIVLSTWFGAGLFPLVPGTFGSLAALPLVLVLQYLGVWWSALILAILTGVAIWASDRTAKLLGKDDPKEVVIDEVAGLLLTTFLLPASWSAIGLGFILFRAFDIIKPFPAGQSEKLPGGLGIVVDDLVAGLYAYAGMRIIFWTGIFSLT
jgi:phosphatidylglycerophosphatase A